MALTDESNGTGMYMPVAPIGGYSRAADDVVERMRDLMQDAPDEQTRQEIQRLVSRMESMM